MTNSTTESFPIADIQSIKFGAQTMILNQIDGTVNTWNIDNIYNYAFDESLELSDQLYKINSSLTIFPNPATNLVNVLFSSGQVTSITIDIIDVNGKQIQQIYQGMHDGEKTYHWNSSLAKGTYYCQIVTDRKVITRPIIIQ
jgi:hypothetical protein